MSRWALRPPSVYGHVAQHLDVARAEVEGPGDRSAGESQVERSGQVDLVEVAVADAFAQRRVQLRTGAAGAGDRVAQEPGRDCTGDKAQA